ncbi:hypothetical protein [Texcoconibacillus texcoconensis]|uniref:Uncharacterized protein n=1 Tax=Texcoconibacillus texcoconensis TaxID=1095777 RepID=A0A840QL53_9BACI|nr:hypothetical protein [Texcoconibacillus texcoconensis]MBB5172093.1 hypothetical protein [Texcoconibacillus texcoconensis]
MSSRNRLLVDQLDQYMNTYREEIAHEFGIFHSAQETDRLADQTSKKMAEKMKDEKDENC